MMIGEICSSLRALADEYEATGRVNNVPMLVRLMRVAAFEVDDKAGQLQLLAKQLTEAHTSEMLKVSRYAFLFAAGTRGGYKTEAEADAAFEKWYAERVLAEDGVGIRVGAGRPD